MIERHTIEGRRAVVQYLTANLEPADEADAELVHVLFDDGESIWLNGLNGEGAPAEDADPDWHEEDHPRGQPDNAGQFGPGGGGAKAAKAAPKAKAAKSVKSTPVPPSPPASGSSLAVPAEVQKPRSKEEPHGVSTRIPSEPQQKKTGINAHETAQHLVDYAAVQNPDGSVVAWLKKATDLLVGRTPYTGATEPYVGMRPGPEDESPHAAAERFINYAKSNILAIYHAVPEEWRQRASRWYDGANTMTDEWSKTYGYSHQQMAGVVASQSPKKDWFQNVEIGKRIIEYNKNKRHLTFNQPAADRLTVFIQTKKEAEAKTRERDLKKGKTPVAEADLDSTLFQHMQDKFHKPDGSWMKLGELEDPVERAAWISMYDLANGESRYKELTPDGDYGDYVKRKDQEAVPAREARGAIGGLKAVRATKGKPFVAGEPTVLVWQTTENIAKALRILDDGSDKSISENLGDAHKVRNFYMNIMYPNSTGGHITADTHAIAGAFLRPLGQNDLEVMVGLGNASPSNNTHGLGGTYPLIAEAYRRAAKEVDLLPRQMQSITWEGIRGIFSPEQKRDDKLRTAVDAVWRKYMNGTSATPEAEAKALADAQAEILKLGAPGGVPRTPGWVSIKDRSAGSPASAE
jgi:hypothetical protein